MKSYLESQLDWGRLDTQKRMRYKSEEGHITLYQEAKKNQILTLMETKLGAKQAAYMSSIDTTRYSTYPFVQRWILENDEYPSFTFSGNRHYEYDAMLELLSKQEHFEILSENVNSFGFPEEGEKPKESDEAPKTFDQTVEENKEDVYVDFVFVETMVAKFKYKDVWFYIKTSAEPRSDCYFVKTDKDIKRGKVNAAARTEVFILHRQDHSNLAEELLADLEEVRIKIRNAKESTINIVIQTNNGYDLVNYEIKDPKIDLDLNYNDDFKEEYDKIIKRLNTPKDKGIVLFHGDPGTGKTTLIKHLLSVVKKKVIFIPPDLAPTISRPEFIAFLMQHSNSILVIEDAENAIVSRDNSYGSNQQAVSNLLNLSDGILSDALSIQIICTFNCSINQVDQALMRKGRLISKYEFKALAQKKAEKLAKHIGYSDDLVSKEVNKDLKLCDIFSLEEKEYSDKKNFTGLHG